MADRITFGGVGQIHCWAGTDRYVNYNSGTYRFGGYAGTAWQVAMMFTGAPGYVYGGVGIVVGVGQGIGQYNTYREHGFGVLGAAGMSAATNLPFASSVVSGIESYQGTSLRAGDYGQELNGYDYADRVIGIGMDLLAARSAVRRFMPNRNAGVIAPGQPNGFRPEGNWAVRVPAVMRRPAAMNASAGTTHDHHTTPREIQRRLPPHLRNDPDIANHTVPFDVARHLREIHSRLGISIRETGIRGGRYNLRFHEEILERGGYHAVTKQQILEIRAQLAVEFGL